MLGFFGNILDVYFNRCCLRVYYVIVVMLGVIVIGKGCDLVFVFLDLMI